MGIRRAITVVRNEFINQADGYRHDDAVIERALNVKRIQQQQAQQTSPEPTTRKGTK